MVDVVNQADRKICVILLRYNAEKSENSYVQVRLFARRKADEKFQQIVYVEFVLEESIYQIVVMISVCDHVITNQPYCNVLLKVIYYNYSLSLFSIRVRMSWNIGYNRNPFLKLKSKFGFYHVVLTKTSRGILELTVVEMQQMPDIEEIDSKHEIFYLKWTIYNGG